VWIRTRPPALTHGGEQGDRSLPWRILIEIASESERAGEHRRRRWVAVILSLVVPGLGHLYAGRVQRAAVTWALSVVLLPLGLFVAGSLSSAPGILLAVALFIGLYIMIAADAAQTVRHAPCPFELAPYNRWFVYLAIIFLVNLGVQPRIARLTASYAAQAFRLNSTSMEPAIVDGDWLLVGPKRGPTVRGDVVVYRTSVGPFVHRVVAVANDTIAMANAQLLLNGLAVREPYESHADDSGDDTSVFDWQRRYLAPGIDRGSYRPTLDTWGPLVVPAGRYLILGDNRHHSLDGRYAGFARRESIIGRPLAVYFSWDADAHAARWNRVGLTLK